MQNNAGRWRGRLTPRLARYVAHESALRWRRIPTRLSIQWLQPYLDKDAASSHIDDTANHTDKYQRHLPPLRGPQQRFRTNSVKTVSKTEYLETIGVGNTVIDTVKHFPTRSGQSRPAPRPQFTEPDPAGMLNGLILNCALALPQTSTAMTIGHL